MPVRNQHPAQLLVMHMPPAATRGLAAGEVQARADAAYSSLWLVGVAPGKQWRMDAEYLRVATGLRVGLGGGVDVAVELPMAHTSGGFLDDFLIDYHDFFGFPDQERDIAPRNAYDISLRQGGSSVWAADPAGAALLDVPVYASWRLTPDRAPVGAAVRGGGAPRLHLADDDEPAARVTGDDVELRHRHAECARHPEDLVAGADDDVVRAHLRHGVVHLDGP